MTLKKQRINYLATWISELIGKTNKQQRYYSQIFESLFTDEMFEPAKITWINEKTKSKLNGRLIKQEIIKMRRFSDNKVYYELHPNFKGNLQSIVDVV